MQNIFDTTDPREDRLLYRAANRLHYQTRESIVRAQLLFVSGELFRAQRLEETERILRGRRYLFDAWVVPIAYDDAANVVDIAVTVRDVWTLNPGVSLGRAGGQNHTKVQIDENNLLGRGSKITLARSHDVDRSSTALSYFDPTAFGTWWQVSAEYADNSDGRVQSLALTRPFYSLDTHHAYAVGGYDGTSHVERYSGGQALDQFDEQHRSGQLYYGWSGGLVNGVTRRWFAGMRYDLVTFTSQPAAPTAYALPEDRRLVYPWVGWQMLEDRYVKSENVDLIGRTEDLYLGRSLYAELGYSRGATTAVSHSVLLRLTGLDAWQPGRDQQLYANVALDGRLDDGMLRNLRLTLGARYFAPVTDSQVFYAALAATTTRRLDGDQQLLLGGDTGLRGYPIRFQGGTSSALLTLEHRVFTNWFPFRLFTVGAAAFFDVGRTWGRDFAGAAPIGTLKDAGLGLRLGNNRSGLGNVLHVDLSYAFDAPPGTKRLQVSVETSERF